MKKDKRPFEKISVKKIVKSHFRTLVNYNTGKAGLDDWATFLGIPLLLGLLFTFLNNTINDSLAGIIITVLSIFVGLLINVLVLIFGIIKRRENRELKMMLLKEVLSNISFSILISIISIFFCLLLFLWDNWYYLFFTSFVLYFLLAHFLITLLMILKRIHNLLEDEAQEQ